MENKEQIHKIELLFESLGKQISNLKVQDGHQASQLIDMMAKYYDLKQELFIYFASHNCELNNGK